MIGQSMRRNPLLIQGTLTVFNEQGDRISIFFAQQA
jgi:hypothetical protein